MLFLLVVLSPTEVYADDYCKVFEADGSTCNATSGKCYPNALAARFVPCLSDQIRTTAQNIAQNVYSSFLGAVYLVVTLAVGIFGIKMALSGVDKIEKEVSILLIKIGVISWMVLDPNQLFTWVYGSFDGLLEVVDSFSMVTLSACPELDETSTIWQRSDCIINLTIGINPPKTLYNGLVGFFFSSLMSGGLGIAIGLIGIYVCFNMLMGMLRASQAYLVALIGVSFLLIIGVIFIPLMLFRNTFEFFRQWFMQALAMLLQPIILFAYINILLNVFNMLIYQEDYSLYHSIAGEASKEADFNPIKYFTDNGLISKKGMGFKFNLDSSRILSGAVSTDEQQAYGVQEQKDEAEQGKIKDNPASIPIEIPYDTYDYAKAAEKLGIASASDPDAAEKMQKHILGALLLVALISYMFVTMLDIVEILAHDLGGGALESPRVGGVGGKLPMEGMVSSGISSVGKGIEQSLVGVRK